MVDLGSIETIFRREERLPQVFDREWADETCVDRCIHRGASWFRAWHCRWQLTLGTSG
jgi:hypothetical protein